MSSASPPSSDTDLDFGPTLRGLRAGWKVFGRYTLVRQLGRGGMGVVWLARDEKLELEVALKFLPDNLKDDLVAVDELRRETKRCLELTHPNIVRIFDLAEDEQMVAIAMEYVQGGTLAALRLEKPTRCFEAAEMVPWIKQVCEALSYAHERARVVHRDLKPSNIMISAGGGVKLADFGIASSLSDTMSRMTRTGAKAGAGTLVYMSPQQLMGYPPSVSDDVYSLGATIYELLTWKPPFFRGSIERQIESVVPPSMAERRAELGIEGAQPVPALWEEVIAACLEKEAEKRPRSVAEVWQRLSGAAVAAGQAAKPAPSAGAQKPQVREPASSSVSVPISPNSEPSSPVLLPTSPISRSRKLAFAALVCVGVVLVGWFEVRPKWIQDEARREAQSRAATVSSAMAKAATSSPGEATKEQPFSNSLGMKFVPVPGAQVLMCVHETRNADYAAYAAAQSGVDEEWKEEAGSGKEQHPVVNVSYEDAEAFCRWLSAKEGKTYRLPTDAEWSAAVGLGKETGKTPEEKEANSSEEVFPWGSYYPPKPGDGNYFINVVNDGYEKTAPVMSFRANELGIYDLGGNVWEWCQDWYDDSQEYRVLRGASWFNSSVAHLRSSYRLSGGALRARSSPDFGFRCVLVVAGG
jgi:serine/threonine protein kinase